MVAKKTQEVEKMKKAYNLITMCARAGQLKTGYDTASKVIRKGTARLVIVSEDFSERNSDKIKKACMERNIPCYTMGTKERFGELLSRKDTGILVTCDKNFANGLIRILADQATETDQEV